MTEDEARQVLLLQVREAAADGAAWTADDRAWATRQAVATVGDRATPERFAVARAVVGLQRLLPRDAAARRWLARRLWHPAWLLLALLLGAVAGVAVDQLGPPQRVNLLAPAVWLVVAWNLVVYATLLLPLPAPGLRQALSRWGRRGDADLATVWARHAAPLTLQRLALLLHAASAALALGLIGGLYLRGLVLDYRAGWQSTFLDADAVQALLGWLLAPASAVTGIAVPAVAPLRVGPDGIAQASAAAWIHLYAATLALWVVLPRGLLALRAGWAARRLARRFPLPLDTPYFAALHPLMQPGLRPAVRLLWAGPLPGPRLFDTELAALDAPLTLLRSDEGDELQLLPLPAGIDAASEQRPRWQRWLGLPDRALQRLDTLRAQADAVLLVTPPDAPRPPWLASLGRPVVVLVDAAQAGATRGQNAPQGLTTAAHTLALHALADGWLPEGRLLQALQDALDGDVRLRRLADSWRRRQQAEFDARMAALAVVLGRIASARQAVPDAGLLPSRRADADAARQALAAALDAELDGSALQPMAAALRNRVGEGRAAVLGGVVTGALAGLKADLLSGGMTMGAGLVTGGLIGALGAAGVARGLNVVRGTDRSFVTWNADVLAPVTQALLQRQLVLVHGLADAEAAGLLAPALAARQDAFAAVWNSRVRRFDNAGEADRLAAALQPLLAATLKQSLGERL